MVLCLAVVVIIHMMLLPSCGGRDRLGGDADATDFETADASDTDGEAEASDLPDGSDAVETGGDGDAADEMDTLDGTGDSDVPDALDSTDPTDLGDPDDDDTIVTPPSGPTAAFLWVGWYQRTWPVARWTTELGWMRDLGIDTVIVSTTVVETDAVYPTAIPGLTAYPGDPLENMLDAADAAAMDVQLGLVLTDGWWTGTGEAYLDDLAALSMAVVSELHARYSSHPSLAGFYITQEIDNMTWRTEALRQRLVQRFLRPLSDHVESLDPSLVVSTAPFFNTVFAPAAEFGAWWDATLADTPSLDLVILQDGIGAEHATIPDVVDYFTSVGDACRLHGRGFWSDMEIYAIDHSTGGMLPAPVERVAGQIDAEAPLADAMAIWEWSSYISPVQSVRSLELNLALGRYMAGLTTVRNVAAGASYTLSQDPMPGYTGVELTDLDSDEISPGVIGWFGGDGLEIDVDLGAPDPGVTHVAAFFLREFISSVLLPMSIAASCSPDGIVWNPAGSLVALSQDESLMNPLVLELPSTMTCSRVKLTVYSSSPWLMASEVAVFSITP